MFTMQGLMDGLKIMGFGMGGIFVVLSIIFLAILALGKIGSKEETPKSN